MKKIGFIVLASLFLSASCGKEKQEEIKADLLIQIMTAGLWSVTHLSVNTTDHTQAFAGYRFKFYENKNVDATFSGVLEKTGTWDASSATMTTSANFVGASHPLVLVNGNWSIIRSSSRIVEASQTIGTEVKTLKMYRE